MPESVVYNTDCLPAMAEMPDNAFDLAIIDPPYGIGENGSRNKSRGKLAKAQDYHPFYGGDKSAPSEEYFCELRRVSKNQIIFGANHFIDKLPPPRDSHCWIVWDKENGATDFADCELAWTSFPTAVRLFRFRWAGMLQGDMKHKEKRIHPTQKPVALYKWILEKYAKDGYKILDTHLGSGSSRIAAFDAGLDFVGFEIDPEYYQKQEERFNTYISQLKVDDSNSFNVD